jgi:hypothetical protein
VTENRDQLIAYLATLAALVVIYVASMIAAAAGRLSSIEALGIGTVIGGLIGVLRTPDARSATVDNSPEKPVLTDSRS